MLRIFPQANYISKNGLVNSDSRPGNDCSIRRRISTRNRPYDTIKKMNKNRGTTSSSAHHRSRSGYERNLPRLALQILESINSGLLVTDTREKVVLFNRAAEEITGFSKESVLGRPLKEAVGEKNWETLTRELSSSTPRLENREIELVQKMGNAIPIGYTVSELIDANEKVGMIFIFKDLSEIIEMRKEMSKKERLAMVGEMTAGIAHELRNPIAAMLTAAETLKDELDYDTEKVEYLNWILGEIKRINALLVEFFSFARPREARKEKADIHEVLDLLIFVESEKMKKTGVTIQCRYGKNVPLITIDKNLMKQALLNILLNAYQASRENGVITITTAVETGGKTREKHLRIEVSDTGEGIPETIAKKIFQPFFSTKVKGIGLGLPITEQIIREHGGMIAFESKPQQGTTFTIRLPLN
jgi:two-component system sensor histidine kinase PilS (NtrC family)